MLDVVKSLVTWLTACWDCDGCTRFSLMVSVISCVLRFLVIVGLLLVLREIAGAWVNEVANTL